ncbi:MgtC/SapB family protein [Vibrio metschnikovii]|nr:MgtC/SapB family protein [Vibrio metschnikovii]EKO3599326.1 MgtC/SapB family protein [Vibrio metschnikovii]EKO3614007.1 MgtC/SapB family protein [Vibrio metschnikovii]EKO3635824.1 MgtC/SapB family protein [Vibrio metschnikovii]EKO3652684.1 MgtC/SapB family protein [Vibrio metschnikovii]
MWDIFDFILPLMLAAGLGAMVGLERQWHQRMAGLRTNALVSLGAASFTLMSMMVDGDASPTRVAAQVVSGIGFLGAGVIMKEGANIRGLNTAATLWCSAAIGVMIGANQWSGAVAVTIVILATNTLLRPLVRFINHRPVESVQQAECWWQYRLEVVCLESDEAHVRALLLQGVSSGALQLQKLESETLIQDKQTQVRVISSVMATQRTDSHIERVIGRLSLEPTVSLASWQVVEA